MIVHVLVLLVIMAPAVARGSQLIVDDKITFPIRRWAVMKLGEEHPITTLVHCIACTSVWLATIAALYSWLFLDLPGVWVAPVAFMLSYLTLVLTKITR